ncbi:carboxypeptidase-like regulatory domain-containing protein [Micromonospora sp. WMMD1102]|uniref:carboxypeptidase-like regulatory domain-containing protein n=1 Tax=Micromonospora sp. WMMD1102 TaxID=3016105 RepID=UPI002414DDF3|nr:carboxypeptidase-like regulatory domain-containing protein [Micromonospora sp. WMMD1102]MDG4790042.1 carboxypeptidase-like regulatory domain-containing protein [Micromonospora sp. WMMD1102]
MELRWVTSMAGVLVVALCLPTTPAAAAPVAQTSAGYAGTVRTEHGRPVPGACLALLRTETVEQATFCTDPAGRYSISGVPTDLGYRVRVTAPGHRTHWWPDAPDYGNAETVWVPGDTVLERDVVLGTGAGTLRGRVVDDSGAPADATVTVWATDRDWHALAYATPDGDGRYQIGNLRPGRYQVSLFDDVHGTQWLPGREDRTDAGTYPLADARTLTLDEAWLPLGTVEVRVTDAATGAPVPRPCARIDAPTRTVESCGAAGLVRLGQVPPGRWEVAVTAAPSHFPPARPAAVEVVRGAVARPAVTLVAGAGLTGTVRDSVTGGPVDRVCVRLVVPGRGGQSAGQPGYCSDATGRLAIGPLDHSATVQLYAYRADDPYERTDRRYGAQWVTPNGGTGDQRLAARVRIRAGRTAAIAPIVMDPPGAIGGTVTDASTGAPVPGVCAYPYAFRPDRGSGHGRHCSGPDGRYTIDDLGPYSWPVQFVPPPGNGYAWQWSGDVADRLTARLTPVAAGRTAELPARLVAGGSLAGTLTRRGVPAGSGYVWTYHHRTGDVAGAGPAHPGPDGRFVLPGHRTQQVHVEYAEAATTCWYGLPADGNAGPRTASPVQVTDDRATTLELDLVTTCAPRPGG